jgi:hypothetical protein
MRATARQSEKDTGNEATE